MKDNYIRQAFVTNVVDGDTFDAEVSLGFTCSVKVRFRIKGIDTPETFRPKTVEEGERGKLAKARTTELLVGKTVSIKSYKMGAYARWEAEVFLEDGRSMADILKAEGLVKVIPTLPVSRQTAL